MMRWRWEIFVKLGGRGDGQEDGRNEKKQEWSRLNRWQRCGSLECQWLIKVSGGSGAWRANTNSCCAVIEGLGLPQGLTNTDYHERYRGIGGCECVLYVCAIWLKNHIQKRTEIIATILPKVFLWGLSLSLRETHWNQSEVFVWISLRNSPGAKAAGTESLKESQTENSNFLHLFYSNTSTHNNLSFSEGVLVVL